MPDILPIGGKNTSSDFHRAFRRSVDHCALATTSCGSNSKHVCNTSGERYHDRIPDGPQLRGLPQVGCPLVTGWADSKEQDVLNQWILLLRVYSLLADQIS